MEEIDLIVLSRQEAQMFVPAAPTSYVSIYTPGDDPAYFQPHTHIVGVLKIAFPDLNIDEHPRLAPILFNDGQAKVIKDFVQTAYDAGIRRFMIHCDAGISRSCGVASALDMVFNNAIALRPRYCCRNSMVERKVLEAFKGPVVAHD